MATRTASRTAGSHSGLPLVLDLDGSLIRADLLQETALAFVRANPLNIFVLMAWLIKGRAFLKRRLAEHVVVDVDAIPANQALADYAARQHADGRPVVLATAADEFLARRIARRFPFIDSVIASDGTTNLKGRSKAQRLTELFPEGFVYAGDCAADMPVWEAGGGAVLVGVDDGLARRAARVADVEHTIPSDRTDRDLLRALRPHQWAKNALIFVPLVLGGMVAEPGAWAAGLLTFLAIGLLASATYLVNDLWDIADDRRHWTKRNRPLASGRMTILEAARIVPLAISTAFLLGFLVNAAVVALLAVYLAVTLAYSFSLKRQPVLDIFVLAVLFTLRLGLGMVAVSAEPSAWLLVFSMFLFASLSFAKRHTEIARLADRDGTTLAGRGYRVADAPLVQGMGISAGIGAVLIMVLYLIEDAFSAGFYVMDGWLWVFPACLFLWIGRVWMTCLRGELDDDPVVFAIRDRGSLALGAVMVIAFALAWIGPAATLASGAQ